MKNVLFSILAVSVLVCPAVMAQGRGGPPDAERMSEHLAQRLDLSDADAELLAQKMMSHRESLTPVVDELRDARAALDDQISADVFDESAIRDNAAQVGRLEADLAVARARHQQEIRGMLTDRQWAEFKEMRERRMRGAMGMGRGRGPGHPSGGPRRGR